MPRKKRETLDEYFDVFHRTWWQPNPAWPGGKEPGAGTRHYIERHVTRRDALKLCKEYNATHDPGFLSDKAEFESC